MAFNGADTVISVSIFFLLDLEQENSNSNKDDPLRNAFLISLG